jgi:cytochrome c oxidase subunit 3
MALFTLGIAFGPAFALLGALVLLTGIYGWVSQDIGYWDMGHDGPPGVNPEGIHPGVLGMLFFLGTELMFFGGLFGYYFYTRANTPAWPPAEMLEHLPLTATAINTVLLVASSFTLHYSDLAIRKNNRKGVNVGMALTILLGVIFLVNQVREYVNLYSEGFKFTSGTYGGIFFGLTGVHGLHVLGGLLFLAVIFGRALKGQFDAERHTGMKVASMYWHFVDIVWVFLFLTLYVRLW